MRVGVSDMAMPHSDHAARGNPLPGVRESGSHARAEKSAPPNISVGPRRWEAGSDPASALYAA